LLAYLATKHRLTLHPHLEEQTKNIGDKYDECVITVISMLAERELTSGGQQREYWLLSKQKLPWITATDY